MKVNSSAFSDVDYDPDQQHLTVTFKSGQVHRYEGVSAEDHQALIGSASIGKAFHRLRISEHPSTKLK